MLGIAASIHSSPARLWRYLALFFRFNTSQTKKCEICSRERVKERAQCEGEEKDTTNRECTRHALITLRGALPLTLASLLSWLAAPLAELSGPREEPIEGSTSRLQRCTHTHALHCSAVIDLLQRWTRCLAYSSHSSSPRRCWSALLSLLHASCLSPLPSASIRIAIQLSALRCMRTAAAALSLSLSL